VVNGGALGTPSSGTVTNLTGTASININGTVGATTANTGSFTSLAYTTTLTGGTGIVNLGSGQFYKDASGLVGIATSTPTSYGKLTIAGNIIFGSPGTRNAAFSNYIGIATTGDPADDSRANIAFTTVAGGASSSSRIIFSTNNYGVSGGERARFDSNGNLLIGTTTAVQKLTVAGSIDSTGTVRTGGYTVATLPAGTIGMRAYVTDALAPGFLTIIVGGGAIVTPVFYNGTNWVAG
jgi:hypothetical protein